MWTWIFIAVMAVLFLLAISPLSWGAWAKKGWRDLHDIDPEDQPGDIEVRAFYRKLAFENVPTLGPNAILKFHDQNLDRLIAEGQFDEANEFRMLQLKDARQRGDRDALNTYTLYKKIISTMQAYDDEEFRRSLRKKFGHIKDGSSVEQVQKQRGMVAPMRLVEREEDFVDEYLRYDGDGAMALKKPEAFEKVDESPEYDDHSDPEETEFKEAIRLRAEKFARKKGLKMREAGKAFIETEEEDLDDEVESADVRGTKPSPDETPDYKFKTQKIRTKDDYKKTDDYKADLSLVRDKQLHYDDDDALETLESSQDEIIKESYEIAEQNIWAKASSEPFEIPTVKPKADDDRAEEETSEPDDDYYSELIDI